MFIFRFLFQTVFMALGQIWANKFRAALTTLGIIIGVAAVIAVSAAGEGMKNYVLDQFASFGAGKVWIFPRFPDGQRERYSYQQVKIKPHEADGLLDKCPSLAHLTPIIDMTSSVQYGSVTKQAVSVQAVRPSWLTIESREVQQGRPLNNLDEEQRLQVCMVNDKAIEELKLDINCVGQRIAIEGRAFTIVGVIETKSLGPMFGGDEARSEVYIPFGTGLMLRPEPRMYMIAQTKSPELFEEAKAEVEFSMRRMRNLRPDEPNTFGVEAIEQVVEQFKQIAWVMGVVIFGIVGISVLVGGIGIMNIMLVSVSERTREIGLRKAVGAQPAVILLQFLIEAVVLCLVGALVGLLLGWSLVMLLTVIPNSPLPTPSIPTFAIVLSVGFSALTGLVFGMFPAIKAARLNPIDALRHE